MSFENSPPPSRVRVPPPPPPGFGDEEYYRLYGRPEEYHRYRERLEREGRDSRNYKQPDRSLPPGYIHEVPPSRPPRRAPPPPGHDHEEYYYYRSYRRSPRHAFEYEDPEFDSYSSNGISGSKVRRAPPPPPSSSRHNQADGSPYFGSNSRSEYEDDIEEFLPRSKEQNNTEYGKDFENFRVTIKNAHGKRRSTTNKIDRKGRARSMDGTPSLSGVDDEEMDEYDEDSCYEDTANEDSEDEESKQRRQRHRRGGGGEEAFSDESRSPSLPKVEPKKKGSIKDRLGSRVPVRPPSPPDSPLEQERRAPPLTPPYKTREAQFESQSIKRKRPPSPLSPPPDPYKEKNRKREGHFEHKKHISTRKDASARQIRGRDQGLSSSKSRQRKLSDTAKRQRSPRNKGNRRNARSWSSGRDNLGSRYGNRSPTPLPGTPRRVREARAREAVEKEGKKNDEKEKRRNNPIYGKSKMRMDSEQKRNRSRDGSNDTMRKSRNDSSRSRKSKKTRSNKDERNRSPSGRRRTSSGGFGKGVIGKNRDRNISGGNRPPTPVPIGSKGRGRSDRKRTDKQRTKSGENESSSRSKKQHKEETTKENEIMLRRLARKRKDLPQSSEADKNHSLAKMAGIEIPAGTSGLNSHKEKVSKYGKRDDSETCSEKSDLSSKDSEDDSGSRSASRSPSRKGRKRDWKSGKREVKNAMNTKSLRNLKSKKNHKRENDRDGSLSEANERSHSRSRSKGAKTPPLPSKKSGKSNEKWVHDKFQETLASPVNDRPGSSHKTDDRSDFGSHWQKIRSERSKERERAGRSRSRSKNRSRRNRRNSSFSSDSSYDSKSRKRRHRKGTRSRSRGSSHSSSRSISTASSSSTGSIHRERRRERKKISRKDRLKISAENNSVVQAATRASQAIMNKQQGNANTESQGQPLEKNDPAKSSDNTKTNDQVNMGLSGKLLEETNTVNGVVVKYSEPSEARKPRTRWRLYVFKGSEELPILYIHRQSAYLLGRDRKVADIPLDHPSCSKQHAALQYRLVDYSRPDGSKSRRVTPYVIDLNSANGTYVNNQKIESQKYVQLLEKDVLKFGFSSREYVMLHDQSKEEQEEDPGLE